MLWNLIRVLAAIVAAVVLYLIGAGVVRHVGTAGPAADEPGTEGLADVDSRYRCSVCGAQVVLYATPEGDAPEAPRHCREPMTPIGPTS